MDLVSVIIPYYKKKKFISKTLDSVINQSYKNLEIIIIYDDENKTDLNFIKKIQQKDNRIKILQNKKKWGLENQEIMEFTIQKENILHSWTQTTFGIKKN